MLNLIKIYHKGHWGFSLSLCWDFATELHIFTGISMCTNIVQCSCILQQEISLWSCMNKFKNNMALANHIYGQGCGSENLISYSDPQKWSISNSGFGCGFRQNFKSLILEKLILDKNFKCSRVKLTVKIYTIWQFIMKPLGICSMVPNSCYFNHYNLVFISLLCNFY